MELTYNNVINFLTKWNRGEINKNWRFGQAFVNIFGVENCYNHPHHQIGSCMFYETNEAVVYRMILQVMQEKEQNTTDPDASQGNCKGD